MTDGQQAVPVAALAYQPPIEAAGDAWAQVLRMVGWAAIAIAAAKLGSAACSFGVRWASGARPGIDFAGATLALNFVSYAPVLAGGLGCTRLRPWARKFLTYSLAGAMAVHAILALTTIVLVSTTGFTRGALGLRASTVGQNAFNAVGATAPLVFLIWLLRRPPVRRVFGVAR
jgi:hypothetical protein